jgi:hypothetical protein
MSEFAQFKNRENRGEVVGVFSVFGSLVGASRKELGLQSSIKFNWRFIPSIFLLSTSRELRNSIPHESRSISDGRLEPEPEWANAWKPGWFNKGTTGTS